MRGIPPLAWMEKRKKGKGKKKRKGKMVISDLPLGHVPRFCVRMTTLRELLDGVAASSLEEGGGEKKGGRPRFCAFYGRLPRPCRVASCRHEVSKEKERGKRKRESRDFS